MKLNLKFLFCGVKLEILRVNNVTKKFGDYKASDNISFGVKKGRIFGLLGPNGAGKTTMIRMITNIYVPDEGSITLFDKPLSPEMQNIMGYLPEERGLYKKMKVIEQLVYFGMLKGLDKKTADRKSREWLIKLNANDWADKKVQDLSKGMAQKVQFISTILHEPPFLVLDEPFSGFDPINAEHFKKLVIEMNQQGTTIILSTHIMHQVEQMCDDIILINKGKSVLQGDIREIKKSKGKNTIILEFEGDDTFLQNLESDVNFINRTKSRVEFTLKGANNNSNDILKYAAEKVNIVKYQLVEPGINEIFIDTVGADNLPKNEEEAI